MTTLDQEAKGKEKYNCTQYECSCSAGKEFNKLNKTKCDFCPYDEARTSYISADVNLTNFHLYLTNSIYSGMTKDREESAKLLIVDEAHELDQVMSDFISIKITDTVVKRFDFPNESKIIKELKNNGYIYLSCPPNIKFKNTFKSVYS